MPPSRITADETGQAYSEQSFRLAAREGSSTGLPTSALTIPDSLCGLPVYSTPSMPLSGITSVCWNSSTKFRS
jgi:hypothetical protein